MADALDGVMSISSSRAGTVVQYAKWKLTSTKYDSNRSLEGYWQKSEENGSGAFLLPDDRDLADLKTILDGLGVGYGIEENVELTVEEKQGLDASGIRSRSDVPDMLAKIARINAVTTLDEMKAEMLTSLASTRL